MDMAEDRVRCTKRSVRIVKKSVKFPSNRAVTARFTVRNAFQNARAAAVHKPVAWPALTLTYKTNSKQRPGFFPLHHSVG
ncbi:MAG: hypothetical protein A3G91_05485 [Omnitrophica WOR_2 bacterium RIFCSPLOWO2_12_FULL_50_9]|nr:MAG: hypothetical protein A3D87_08215 [Omnitrophica WOR_2 bacterium RIFCSPHIGHO2_02_FULL_50_17]OGX41098.1 MAG: hypothetical protein A3G91_05485 [Omnitrophica WOR_2 bacterium RIFCSPLOWO2_12_FULL_50_9]